jgi:hypothetical protein
MTLVPMGVGGQGLAALGSVAYREVERVRAEIAQTYHSLNILSAWCGHQAWKGRGAGQAELGAALSLVATVTRQQSDVGRAEGLVPVGANPCDWDLEAEYQGLDFVESADAVVEELWMQAQSLLDRQVVMREEERTILIRAAGSLLSAAANLHEVVLKCRKPKP